MGQGLVRVGSVVFPRKANCTAGSSKSELCGLRCVGCGGGGGTGG